MRRVHSAKNWKNLKSIFECIPYLANLKDGKSLNMLSGNNLKLRFVRNTRAVFTFDLGYEANFQLVNHMCVNTYTRTLLS